MRLFRPRNRHFTGTYSEGFADVDGTALVGSNSIPFRARLTLKSPT
jgi:hypothetical protein